MTTKISVVSIIVFIAFTYLAYEFFLNYPPKYNPTQFINPNPELQKIIFELKKKNDSLTFVANKRDTFIHETIKYIKTKANAFNAISADSNVELFAKWNEKLQDSCSRQRYFCIGACDVDCE